MVLSQILSAAVREGRIGRNVARGIKLPKIPRIEAAYFEPEVVERIASSVGEPYTCSYASSGSSGRDTGRLRR